MIRVDHEDTKGGHVRLLPVSLTKGILYRVQVMQAYAVDYIAR